jgi:hypothetical protein
MQDLVAIHLGDNEGPHALAWFAAGAGAELKLMTVEGTDHFPVANETFGQGTLPVRAKVLRSEDAAVALTKDRDLQRSDDVAAALAGWHRVCAAQVDLS